MRETFRRRLSELESWRGQRGRLPQPVLVSFGFDTSVASFGHGLVCRRCENEPMAAYEYRATAAALDAHRPGAAGPIIVFTREELEPSVSERPPGYAGVAVEV